jgi:alpha-beta hydrolase superfamily lysophospholipase
MAAALCRLACCALALLLASCAGVLKKPVRPTLGKSTWTSYDGKEMPWNAGKPVQGEPRAVVITVHGLSGSATDFWMLDDAFPPEGIAVYGLQLRGMGNDPDKLARGDIKSADVWQRDLLTFHTLVRQQHPNAPVYWYAESLGTLIAMHTVVNHMDGDSAHLRPAGMILSSPAAGLRLRPRGPKATVLYAMIFALPWMKVNLEKLAGVKDKDIRVTHDTTFGAQMAVTSHYVSHFSLRLLGETDKMMRQLPDAASQMHVPVLVLATPNDVIASEQQVSDFFKQIASSDKTIRWYRKSYHLLLHDTERQDVLRDATQWLERHVQKGGSTGVAGR